MQNPNSLDFNIRKESDISNSFRSESIRGKYDIQSEKIIEEFKGKIDLEDDNWNIGVIYGSSGTGKTTIAKNLFPSFYFDNFYYDARSVIDDFSSELGIDEILSVLSNIGFSSPPSWLKPYKVLSEGEKMRVNLAMAVLSDKNLIVFDEFTSTVDRNVAKIGSYAISKYIKSKNKKFIAISCHDDILNWLEPDWIFSTDYMKTEYVRGYLQRPKIELKIHREKGSWDFFRKYHYLDSSLNNSSHQFVGEINNRKVCFMAVLHQPNAHSKNLKRVSRIVVHPDYQGIGIGSRFIDYIGNYYKEKDMRLTISLSHYGFIRALKNNNKWAMVGQGRRKPHSKLGKSGKFSSFKRVTASFEYVG